MNDDPTMRILSLAPGADALYIGEAGMNYAPLLGIHRFEFSGLAGL